MEFKQSIPSKASDLAEEVCAFANAAGGVIIIGLTDKGAVVGATLDNVTRSRLQNIVNAVEPHFQTKMQEVNIQGKTVLCIECPSGKQKPYTVSGSIIIRNGPNSERNGEQTDQHESNQTDFYNYIVKAAASSRMGITRSS